MRILAFNYEYPPLGGGGGVVFKDLCDELARRHEVTIVTSHFGDLAREETVDGQQIHRVPVWFRTELSTATMPSMLAYPLTSWRRGRALLARQSFDVITSHFVVPTAPSAQRLATAFGVPHVLNVLGGDLYDPSKRLSPHRLPGMPAVVRSLLSRADRVVAGSSDTAANARRYYGFDGRVDVIELGIVEPPSVRGLRSEFDIGEERFVMAVVGRLVARKGLDDLLRVVHSLDDERDLLLVIGDGPEREALESTVRELGIERRVRFLGRVSEEDKWKILDVADLFVSTSIHEGFGLVFLEAMHCSLPVVCYDRGGQTDFLEDGVTGGVVPLGDRTSFVAAVASLRDDRGRAARCAQHNRARVRDFYIDRYAQRHEALFEELVEAGARR